MRHTITVAGGGSWGTALAHLLAVRGHRTRLWLRDAAVAGAINSRHENPRYLPGLALHPGLEAGTDPGPVSYTHLIPAPWNLFTAP